MQLAIFGGSFDPIHIAHEAIVNKALDSLEIDKIIVVPTYLNPFKSSFHYEPNIRFNLLKKVFNNNPKIEICDYEINQNRPVYSIETANYLKNLYKPSKIFIIIGEDNVRDFVYELELYEGVISFEYDFPSSVDILTCELEIDDRTIEYTYNREDDDSLKEEIEYEFLKETTFSCDEELDELELKIEDPRGFDIYDLLLKDEDEIEFDENTPRHIYDLALFFTKDFNEEEVECDVEIDSVSDFTLEFDDSSSGSERTLEYVFGETFEISCDDEFEEAIVDIVLLEDDDEKVFEGDYYDQRTIRISKNDIENWEEKEDEIVEEKEEEKIIVPQVVNPRPTQEEKEEEPIEETTVTQEEAETTTTSTLNDEEKEINSSTQLQTNSLEIEGQKGEENNSTSIIYTFIGIISIILLIVIIVFLMKL